MGQSATALWKKWSRDYDLKTDPWSLSKIHEMQFSSLQRFTYVLFTNKTRSNKSFWKFVVWHTATWQSIFRKVIFQLILVING